jgi:tetratricopeptide (TPR) repeat protein
MMKKTILQIFICLFFGFSIFAQKASPNKAYNHFFDKEFTKAKEAIDMCMLDEKLAQKAQTWLYKANIYYSLSNQEYDAKRENSAYKTPYPDAAEQAFDAFVRAKEMNKNVEGYEMLLPNEGIVKLCVLLFVCGVDELIGNNYESAKRMLEKAVTGYEFENPPPIPLNGELYYYYAYSLEMLNDMENAAKFYNKAILDGSNNMNVFLRLIENYKKEKNTDKIKEILNAGKKSLPGNPALYVYEIDYYYYIGEKTAAHKLMENIPDAVFENADLLVNVANFYILDTNYSKAYQILNNANLMMPHNFVIYYNLGVCTYYLAEECSQKANALEVKGDKINAMASKTEAKNYLQEAENYFEYVHQIEPQDISVMQTLRSIYARLESPKYDAMDAKIKAAE